VTQHIIGHFRMYGSECHSTEGQWLVNHV